MAFFGVVSSRLLAPALFVAFVGTAHAADRTPFTIADVMRAPYPTNLVAASKGSGAAWVFNAQGVRNIWVSDSPDGAPRQVTSYRSDDGFDIGELAWSPDARLFAYVRGQTIEDGKPANVVSAPGGPVPREIWVVSASGGAPRKIGNGDAPSFSPDGSRLIYLDGHRILAVDPYGNGAATPLLTDQGIVTQPIWSSDGRKLAFVSNRGDHSLIGVYDIGKKTIAWMGPSFDRDSSPRFFPRRIEAGLYSCTGREELAVPQSSGKSSLVDPGRRRRDRHGA